MMHRSSICHIVHSSLFPAGTLVLALIFSAPLTACKKHQEGDGHNHGAAAGDGHTEGDGHDDAAGAEHADEVTLTSDAVEHYGVTIGTARLRALKPTFVAPARVGFNTEAMAHVGSPLVGRAVEIKVRLGDQVKTDDPLVVVESPELGQAQADYLIKLTAAEAAVPQVGLAKSAWDRAKSLLEQSQGISLTEVQKREAEFKTAEANLRSAQATAVASENALYLLGMDEHAVKALASTGEVSPRSILRAAIDGQVVQREVTLGELVNPQRESLMILADTSTLWVLADVPEARLRVTSPGARAMVAVGSSPGIAYEGTVAFIAPLVDPTTRTAQVRVEVPSSALRNGAVRPGMFAQVEIVAASPGGAEPTPQVAVPQEAVQTVEGSPAVFVPVAGEPNTFQKRALTVGPAVGGLVPVLAGLAEGEQFVEAGSFILKAELGKESAAHEH